MDSAFDEDDGGDDDDDVLGLLALGEAWNFLADCVKFRVVCQLL
jgi:hypothetical protein